MIDILLWSPMNFNYVFSFIKVQKWKFKWISIWIVTDFFFEVIDCILIQIILWHVMDRCVYKHFD
jgi:hypothetical protein